jgi:hypothetical protein
MADIALPIATTYFASSLLTLAVPLVVLIAVTIWYVVLWRRGAGER